MNFCRELFRSSLHKLEELKGNMNICILAGEPRFAPNFPNKTKNIIDVLRVSLSKFERNRSMGFLSYDRTSKQIYKETDTNRDYIQRYIHIIDILDSLKVFCSGKIVWLDNVNLEINTSSAIQDKIFTIFTQFHLHLNQNKLNV